MALTKLNYTGQGTIPDDGNVYKWNEETTTWVETTNE